MRMRGWPQVIAMHLFVCDLPQPHCASPCRLRHRMAEFAPRSSHRSPATIAVHSSTTRMFTTSEPFPDPLASTRRPQHSLIALALISVSGTDIAMPPKNDPAAGSSQQIRGATQLGGIVSQQASRRPKREQVLAACTPCRKRKTKVRSNVASAALPYVM